MHRSLSVLALCLLSACAVSPAAEVTKGAATEAGFGISLPPAEALAAPVTRSPGRGNAELARDFLDLEFRMESGRSLPVLTRFEGPITVGVKGNAPASAQAELQRLISRFRSEAGLDLQPAAAGTTPSITIEFQPRSAMQRVVPTAACFVVPNVTSFAEYRAARNTAKVDWAQLTRREHVAIFVPSDTSPQEVRDCMHEEMAQALGPLNDLYHLTDSVFNDDNFHTVLTGFDMLMLRLHYAPELRSAMNEAEVASRLPAVLARLNPAGQGLASNPKTIAPRTWVDAVENAFGVRGGPEGRLSAAERMLSMAMAQGWTDGRLAFSWYAVGRAQVVSDPERAVKAFTEARRIWRALPGGEVHVAHVDMQLAAVALSSGQNEAAISFADRAIPPVRAAQNAGLLATLMLIKAEALDNLGRGAEARALRLDSQPWARYGFGAERQMRARTAEIAQLGARGARG